MPEKGCWMALASGQQETCLDNGLFRIISFCLLLFFSFCRLSSQSQVDLMSSSNRGSKKVSFSVTVLISSWCLLGRINCKGVQSWPQLRGRECCVCSGNGHRGWWCMCFLPVLHEQGQVFIGEEGKDQRGFLLWSSQSSKCQLEGERLGGRSPHSVGSFLIKRNIWCKPIKSTSKLCSHFLYGFFYFFIRKTFLFPKGSPCIIELLNYILNLDLRISLLCVLLYKEASTECSNPELCCPIW